ncbi:DNA topoisomerase I [Candidatus Woesearchaeota archaeon CG10_big_fil_rev_8_21_14_0_10_37_12]|nr:MAG: DNA topoisomerase I [Candidatus Woesearchaeota archaeon CG10_big_fil_rev_8_21_14_0_10_37_12]
MRTCISDSSSYGVTSYLITQSFINVPLKTKGMYELVITEKPNASKRVAEALSDSKPVKKDIKGVPYYELTHNKKDIVVGCAVGHLFGLAEKEKSKGFKYPVFDIEWKPNYEVSKSSAFSKKYLDALKKLSKEADSITIATDYDVEGEVIGLNVVRYACKKKDAKRMKFSTLTKDELIESYEKAQSHLDWGQAQAGETRHFLDFFYGINLSRALTSAIKTAGMFKILSIGRVQGPALKVVVDREREIQKFKPDPYWMIELNALVKKEKVVAWHEADKFWDKKKADEIYNKIKDEKKVLVKEVSKKQVKQQPPVPFDLTTLQTEAYRCFGINPKITLELAQELYSNGWISYPRTSSQELPESIGFKKIFAALAKNVDFKTLVNELLKKKELKPNNGKKTDPAHPAIYPTGIMPKSLEKRQEKVYDLIVKRFLATFSDPAVRETVTAKLDVNNELFIAKGTRTVEKNWHVFYAPYVKLEEEELPEMKEKDELTIKKIVLHEDETKPPKRYTPASLIKELEKHGLGTKATRAEVVETLRKRNYVKGESIVVTELGIETVNTLEKFAPKILDEELTRHFEQDMEEIRENKTNQDKVLTKAKEILVDLLKEFKSKEKDVGEELKKTFSNTRADLTTVGECPTCKEGSLILRKGKFGRFIACDKYPECKTTFKLPANGLIEVTPSICETCKHPVVKVIKKAKRPQEICINVDCPSKNIPDVKEEKCEKCKEGNLVLRKSIYGGFLACNKFPKCRNIKKLPQKEEIKK